MNYEELKNFILHEMNMVPGKNYQPVMIKALNKNEGKISKDDLKLALQKANPEYELSYFNDCPAFIALTETHPVARYDKENKIFYLLDFETFTDQEKAWVTMYCDQKIGEQSEQKYFVIGDEKELKQTQKIFLENLKKYTTKQDKIIIGFPGPGENVDGDADFISDVDLWWHSHNLPDEAIPRFWNCFGLGEPIWKKNNNIVLEINPPMKGISRQCRGAFVKDQQGNIFICHDGVLGGGNTPGGFYDVYPHEEKWIQADDGKKELRDLILISDITSPKLHEELAEYVKTVAKFKSGTLLPQKVPYYLLFRHKSENNPYEDDPSGKTYHFPKRNPNATKVVQGAKAIWFDKINRMYYFWGYGTVSKVKSRTEKDSDAVFEDFTFFEKQPDSLELNERFLKKATSEIEEKIIHSPGYNNQHSILEINKEIFEDITGNKKIESNATYDVGHKLFLIEMEQKKHKIPFTSFDHVDFIEEELNYKQTALDKSLTELSLDEWDSWKNTPQNICQVVRNAVAVKISTNLIWHPPQNTEIGYFDELDDSQKIEFGKYLYDLFKGLDSIEKRYDNFVTKLEKINRKPEPRLLSYLMFLYDSKKYFPILPTNFDNLLKFYGYEKIKEVSWKKYSQYLELASKLKFFLSKKFPGIELTNLQIQSYMWVIAGAVSKNYWLIRPDTDGADWENQKNRGIIGIHYYTLDLNQYTNSNKQLSKRKVQEKFQELRQIQGKEPDSQGGLDADFGQLEKIFSVRKKDKIVAISNNSTLLGIGNATDKYQFRTDVGENCHTVPVNWYDAESRPIPKQESRRSIKNLSIEDYVNLMSSQTIVQTSEYKKFFNILNKKKQFFFYGPPGTGKTFSAKKIAKEFIKESETKSFSDKQYNEYVLSMINKISHENEFEVKKQTDNNIIIKNSKTEIRIYINYSKSGKTTPHDCYIGISQSAIDFLNQTNEENRFVLVVNSDVKNFVVLPHSFIIKNVKLSGGENWDSSGVADHSFHVHVYDDKSQFRANEDHDESYVKCDDYLSNIEILFNENGKPCNKLEKVTFHQSFSYEEFIEGIRPKTDKKIHQVTYPIEDGIFKRMCSCARIHDKENFVLIIDEINRGNISKIFGELITLLENDKRGDQVTLPYSKKTFSVPENLYVIGTMNTADRSLVHIDAALKRRFGQYELMPDYTKINDTIGRVHLGRLLETINGKIIKAKFRDNQIGHSYFMNREKPISTIEELQFAFAYDIVPLLKDYFYDDDKLLGTVLGNQFIDGDRNIISKWTENEPFFLEILEKAYPEAFDE